MTRTDRFLVIAVGALALLVLLLGGGLMGPGMMWRYGGPYSFGWGHMGPFVSSGWPWGLAVTLGGLMMLAFWAAITLAIVLIVRRDRGSASHENHD